ncbi:hypothetical protein FQA39_LY16353 [Lamprigera yunnana]|nr:hypothetical protein FQA39_LY16353 [Lamprigera yunnana]
MKGFRETEIYHLNKNLFLEADFIAAEADSGKTCSQTPELNVQCIVQQQRETDLDNESAVVSMSPPLAPTPPDAPLKALAGTSKFGLASPFDISDFPVASKKNSKCGQKSIGTTVVNGTEKEKLLKYPFTIKNPSDIEAVLKYFDISVKFKALHVVLTIKLDSVVSLAVP